MRQARQYDVFQALADSTRREITRLLADEEMPVTAIVEHFPITRTAVNKHLCVLTSAGLLDRRKVGRETRYKLNPDPLHELSKWVSYYERYWDKNLAALKKYVEEDQE
ncbi:MAG: metalloregulator ArsR/SmtB family transcription factor [Chloroflexi bacterium]|nr:metalloregulator ArsR/SmtB family transcription factor [Chloroflexota bacterium]